MTANQNLVLNYPYLKDGSYWLHFYLHHLLFVYRTKPHDSTGESPFYLLYGHNAWIPTEAALYASSTLHMLDATDYRTELVTGLSAAWGLITCLHY